MASTSTSGRGEQERDPFLVLEPPHKKGKSSLIAKQYDVFINHRGSDVKTTLARQLYDSLQQAGIRTYLDSEEIELGDYFPYAIKNAIFSAAVHIAILSPRYAESAWCLAELELMFRTKARIIPLFYHVQPSDFRYIKNGVADAFSKHKKKGRSPDDDIQQWKECLQYVSGIKGYELNGQNDDLKKLCEKVVYDVFKEKHKRKIPLQVAKYEVGLDELVNDFHSHCRRNEQMIDKIIGIFGVGGSGKTTLAKYLFNRKHAEFSGSTILFDVREKHVKGELTSLQGKLLNDLFGLTDEKILSIEGGTASIKHYLQRSCGSRFLLVIDDVDHQMQLDALLPIDALNPNSLVIVTTRDERVLIQAGVRLRYKMKEMNTEHSRELFCWHAFHRPSCKPGFDNLVGSFVKECGGLPLALRVMGGHVFGSDEAYWKLQLHNMKARVHRDIEDKLKISYDVLVEYVKQIFMKYKLKISYDADVKQNFMEDKLKIIYDVLEEDEEQVFMEDKLKISFDALEEDEKQIFMDIACFFIGEDVGRGIKIWNASGWRAEHALQTLKDKCLVEVQSSDMPHYEPTFILGMHGHLLSRKIADNEMSRHRRLWRPKDLASKSFRDILKEAQTQRHRCFNSISDKSISEKSVTYFIGNSNESTTLQWLELNGSESIPEWIPLKNLEGLRIRGRLPRRLWHQDQAPLELKELVCKFTDCGLMEKVMLRRNWNEFLKSLGILSRLESLVLQLESQEYRKDIVIEWNSFVESARELNCLKTLGLLGLYINGEIALRPSREPTNSQLSLEAITLSHVGHTSKISISGPSLKSLKLKHMKDLIEVNLSEVVTLECLELIQCDRLTKVVADALPKLEMLSVERCWEIEELPNLSYSHHLDSIKITCCEELQNIIIGFEELHWMKSITITCCSKLQNVTGLKYLRGLKYVILSDGGMLSCVSELQELPSEFTIVMGKAATSFPKADEMAGIFVGKADGMTDVADALNEFHTRDEAYNRLQLLLEKTQQSPSAIILCVMVDCYDHGSKYMFEGRPAQTIDLSWAGGKWIYMILVTNGKHMYSATNVNWMPISGTIEDGYILPVNEDQGFKTLNILKRLTERLTDTSNSSVETKRSTLKSINTGK